MKIITYLLLFAFVNFLITPTIVSIFKKDADISTYYSFSEEEKAQKEIKAVIIEITCTPIDLSEPNRKSIFSENLSKHDNISSKIFIPPPEQV